MAYGLIETLPFNGVTLIILHQAGELVSINVAWRDVGILL